jgi:hypothetical protein
MTRLAPGAAAPLGVGARFFRRRREAVAAGWAAEQDLDSTNLASVPARKGNGRATNGVRVGVVAGVGWVNHLFGLGFMRVK